MTNNPTIDGVSQVSFRQVLAAYDYANSHPHKYLRGTTNWCAAVAYKLNELLHSPDACRCRRFGKDNPHWPCPVHSAQGDPTAAMTEAGCQAYMDSDGMIGIMHKSSMGHAYIAMRALDPELSALQSRIDQLEAEAMYAAATYQAARARIEELESGRGEPVVAHDPCNWSDRQILDFIGVALRNVDPLGSVVLNEIRQGFKYMRDQYACLDATAALNTLKPAEWHDVAGDDEGLVS